MRWSPVLAKTETSAGQGSTPGGALGATARVGGTATSLTPWTSEIADDVPRYQRVRTWTSAG